MSGIKENQRTRKHVQSAGAHTGIDQGKQVKKKHEKHGGTGTRLHDIWRSMRSRCNYKKHASYYSYGEKGIKICAEWDLFSVFRKWALSNGYSDVLTIDRIDNNKGYFPGNCRFVTAAENNRNRDFVRLNDEKITKMAEMYSSGKYTQKEIGEFFGVSRQHAARVLKERFEKMGIYKKPFFMGKQFSKGDISRMYKNKKDKNES